MGLDPRPARKLTSRECAKVLGGAIGGVRRVIMDGPAGPEHLREIVRSLASDDFWGEIPAHADESAWAEKLRRVSVETWGCAPSLERLAMSALGGLIGGLVATSSRRAVRTAVQWWAETDEAWV